MTKRAMTKEDYHYTECGLDNVYLANGFEFVESSAGGQLVITDIEGLHAAIGECLVNQRNNLSGKELRFLRHEMLMSQSTLARLLGVSEQAVRRWETGKSEAAKPAETLIRLLYREYIRRDEEASAPESIKNSLKRIADLEDEIGRLTFQDSNQGWKLAA